MPDAVTLDMAPPDTQAAPEHYFFAEATALKGELQMPLVQTIDPQANAKLHYRGGYLSQTTGEFRIEKVISYKSAHTQVSGIKSVKDDPAHGHATLSTAVIEGLNILQVVTCDLIVSQISTEHVRDGYTPEITFLGTRFENLKIAGKLVDVTLDIDTIGPRPLSDLHYLHDRDEAGFLVRIKSRIDLFRNLPGLPKAAFAKYTGEKTVEGHKHSIDFSLVTGTRYQPDLPGKIFGHVIHVPNFGDISLATVKITLEENPGATPRTTVELTMMDVEMGCMGHGGITVGPTKTNGNKGP